MTTNKTPTPLSDTPRTDAQNSQCSTWQVPPHFLRFARQLERELNEAKKRIAILERRPMTAEEICQP